LTADTSVVIAALSAWHGQHELAARAVRSVTAHAVVEAYAVLTRLPGGRAVPPTAAAGVLAERFPDPPLRLADEPRSAILDRLAAAGVTGGAAFDGLVGLEASAHGRTLLTLDARARSNYQRLGVPFELLGP
jgi:toxin FitB